MYLKVGQAHPYVAFASDITKVRWLPCTSCFSKVVFMHTRPQDTWPLDVLTLSIRGFELVPKSFAIRRFYADFEQIFFNNNQISWALLYLIFANLDRLLEFYPMNDVRFMQFFHSQLMDNWGFSASAGTYSVLWRYHSSIKVMCLLKSFQHSRCKFLIQVLLSALLWSSLFIVIDILLWVEKQNLAMIFDLPGCTFLQCRDAVSTNHGIAVSKSSIKKW